jgi:hypothetical protein
MYLIQDTQILHEWASPHLGHGHVAQAGSLLPVRLANPRHRSQVAQQASQQLTQTSQRKT